MAKTYHLKDGSIQHLFNQSRNKVQIFGGAFANGKSSALNVKACQLVEGYPGCLGLMGRATYAKLNDTLRRDFIEDWCPRSWVKRYPTQDDNTIYFINGSAIHFRYIAQRGKTREDGSTTSNLLSATYDWAVIDQIEDPEITHKDFLDILGRLRRQTPYRGDDDTMPSTGPRWLMLGANPAQNWFYREVVYPLKLYLEKGVMSDKLIVDVNTGKPLIDLFEDSTYGNKHNLTDDYIQMLEAAYKGQMRDRYLLGKWAAFEGLVHPGFDLSKHLVKREMVLDHLHDCVARHVKVQAIEGYDFGITAPSCYLLGFVDDLGRVFIIDGFHVPNFDYSEQPMKIFELRSKYLQYLKFDDPILADPAIFKSIVIAKRKTGTTIANEFRDMGIDCIPADNSIIHGIAKVNAYLNDRHGWPDFNSGDPAGPLIYFVEDLTFISDEMGSYYWKRNSMQNFIDEPVDHDDHAPNVIKYMLSKLPEPAKIVVPSANLPPGWMYWREMEPKEYAKRSRRSGRGL